VVSVSGEEMTIDATEEGAVWITQSLACESEVGGDQGTRAAEMATVELDESTDRETPRN
jgi:hypothetical protein